MARAKSAPASAQSSATIGFEAKLVDCMVALPGERFYSTQIPVCLWLLAKNKNEGKHRDTLQQLVVNTSN